MDDPDGYNDIHDLLTKHNVADHTVHHTWMGSSLNDTPPLDPTMPQCCDCTDFTTTCDSEVSQVETVLSKMSNGGKTHCTRFRPPYGWPYETPGQQGLADVEPVVAKYAVFVGWNFETHDADNQPCSCIDETAGQACSTDTQNYNTVASVVNQVMTQIGSAPGKGTAWGVVLLHGVLPWTAAAIRELFGPNGQVTKAGFRTGTVEDAICWKYGMHSWDIVNKINSYTGASARGPN
jgi:hypothetical protein